MMMSGTAQTKAFTFISSKDTQCFVCTISFSPSSVLAMLCKFYAERLEKCLCDFFKSSQDFRNAQCHDQVRTRKIKHFNFIHLFSWSARTRSFNCTRSVRSVGFIFVSCEFIYRNTHTSTASTRTSHRHHHKIDECVCVHMRGKKRQIYATESCIIHLFILPVFMFYQSLNCGWLDGCLARLDSTVLLRMCG